MKKSDSFTKIAAAFVVAQTQVDIAIKNAVNPHLKNKYADLGAVYDACSEALKTNKLGIAQLPVAGDSGHLHLETMLIHESGEWLCSEIKMPLVKNDAQGYGSALTYARRYALAAMMGVTQDDEDGARASSSGMESAALEWADKIKQCDDMDSLKSTFQAAYSSVGENKDAKAIVAAAKDARKKELTNA